MPQQNPLRPTTRSDRLGNDIIDIKEKSLYARLKKMFSTDAVVRHSGGKKLRRFDTDDAQFATDRNSLRDRFNRVRSTAYNAYTRDFALSYQAARLDLFRDYDCVGPDTVIPLPDGTYPTISELAEKYKDRPQERFWVFSYDHETDSIKLGKAYHPRKKKGVRQGYKVMFDDGSYVIGSLKHPFLMRDGSYKRVFELRVGDSVMPFYQKEYGYNKHGFKRYRRIYNFSKGWQSEHKIVAEQFYRPLEKNEVVHHKNFKGSDNTPDNLGIMDWREHKSFHGVHNKNVLWGDENYENQLKKLKSHPNYINRKFHCWNGKRKGWKNPFYGKFHTNESNKRRSETLKEVFQNRDQSGEKNPKYRSDITFDNVKQKAFEYYKEYSKINLWDFIQHIHCDHSTLQNRLQKEGHDWKSFKQEVELTLNHKIVSIECIGEVEVYDVTVEKYANFATDSCIVSNTMDMDPIIASALDVYADECLVPSEFNKIVTIKSDNDNIRDILDNFLYEILNVKFNLWSWVRNFCKYGDFYLKLHISPKYGIYMVEPISAYNVERIENSHPTNKNYVKFQVRPTDTTQSETLENFEIAHFRLLSDSNFLPYGKSMIESARRIWKQVSLMEDAMLIHRIMRAPEKRIFQIDVGNIPPSEVEQYMNKIISTMKKVPYVDERTGEYNLRFNLQNMVEDFFLPVRGGDSGTKIDTLPGMEFTGIEDIEYLRNKMMAALKIPKAFLGYEEGLSGKATLAAEDVRFARTIGRIQNIIVSELTKMCIIHLYSQGYRDDELLNFKLELTNPSTIFEKEKVALWADKIDVAMNMIEAKLFSKKWIYKNIFNMTEDDIEEIQGDIVEDQKQNWRFKMIEEEGNDPAKPFKKINPQGEGSPGEGPEGLPDLGGGGEGPGGGEELPLPPGGPEPMKEEAEISETDSRERRIRNKNRPSQEGEKIEWMKKSDNVSFGEDPLGDKEIDEKPRPGREIRHVFKGNSPLTLESVLKSGMIKNLDAFLRSESEERSELLEEAGNQKSMLDEGNILDS